MPQYNQTPLVEPQFIAASAAALTFATTGAPTAVPANYRYLITSIRVTNVTNAPVSLTVWRVPSGSTAINVNLVTPATVLIIPATATAPHFDLTVLWGAVLVAGDAIFAQAGSANALTIQGDGAAIVP